jgi:hypothetical protein
VRRPRGRAVGRGRSGRSPRLPRGRRGPPTPTGG